MTLSKELQRLRHEARLRKIRHSNPVGLHRSMRWLADKIEAERLHDRVASLVRIQAKPNYVQSKDNAKEILKDLSKLTKED